MKTSFSSTDFCCVPGIMNEKEMAEECIHCHKATDAEIIEVCHCCGELACPWCIDEKK